MKLAAAICGLGLAVCLGGACQRAPAPGAGQATGSTRHVTFYKDVAPILFDHCATCHRPIQDGAPAQNAGELICVAGAPFGLLDYESARTHAFAIARATATRSMPPWLPEPGYGDFVEPRRLRDDQIAILQRWADEGAPEGNLAELPPRPTFADGWQLGKPDLVVTTTEPYTLRPGAEVFRSFVMPVPPSPTRYVRAIEFRATNPRVLHHANVAVDPGRIGRRLDRADPGPGFAEMPEDEVQNVFGWSPGKVPKLEPEDTAWALEEGSDLVVQLHMVPGKDAEEVQPQIGLFFSSHPPTRVPIVVTLQSKTIDIPAGEANYVIEDSYVLPVDVDAVSVYPHAHYLGKEMRGTAVLPDGEEKPLIWIKQWDIRWQDQYRFREPVFLPRGTSLRMRFTYDNSAANPRNPHHPPRRVRWGPRSTDEMGALWLEVVPRRSEDADVLTRDYYRRALQTDIANAEMEARVRPREPSTHNLLAMKYLQAGRQPEAQQQLAEALRLDPRDAEAHSNLGTLFQIQGRLADAMSHLDTAERLKPDDDRIRFNRGNGLLATGHADDALREFQRAIALNPDNADAHFNVAVLLGPRGRLTEATAHLKRVIDLSPRNGEAHRNLAVALGLQGRIDEAIEEARAALRIEPGSPAARQELDRLLAARQRR